MTNLESLTFDLSAGADFDAMVSALHEHGAVLLRGVFDPAHVAFLADETNRFLRWPAVAGSLGYYKKDHNKRLVDPFVIGGAAVDICLNERVISIVERYMASECVLSEAFIKEDSPSNYVYFPMHTDYALGTRKRKESQFAVTERMMETPLGVGGILYISDSREGAFTYCLGTHSLMAPCGARLSVYPVNERKAILATRLRMEGKIGDLILFDDRGFHGPDQPSTKWRRVLILDWMRVASWGGRVQAAPLSIYTSDLGRLTPTQFRVLGVGAKPLGPRETYHLHSFAKDAGRGTMSLSRLLIENSFRLRHWTHTAGNLLRHIRD